MERPAESIHGLAEPIHESSSSPLLAVCRCLHPCQWCLPGSGRPLPDSATVSTRLTPDEEKRCHLARARCWSAAKGQAHRQARWSTSPKARSVTLQAESARSASPEDRYDASEELPAVEGPHPVPPPLLWLERSVTAVARVGEKRRHRCLGWWGAPSLLLGLETSAAAAA
jgi:hypothetical protein